MKNKNKILKDISRFVCLELCIYGKLGIEYQKCKDCKFPDLINSLIEK